MVWRWCRGAAWAAQQHGGEEREDARSAEQWPLLLWRWCCGMARATQQHGEKQGEEMAHGKAQARKMNRPKQKLELKRPQNGFSEHQIGRQRPQIARSECQISHPMLREAPVGRPVGRLGRPGGNPGHQIEAPDTKSSQPGAACRSATRPAERALPCSTAGRAISILIIKILKI